MVEWVGTYISYQGILNDAEIGKLSRGSKTDNNALAGGIYLDILGLIVFVQYGSIFIGQYIDWLLVIAPAIYGLVKWLSKSSDGEEKVEEQDDGIKKELEERRRKRAERRRQKRA